MQHINNTDYSTDNRFKELADLLPQSVFEVDETGRLTYVNKFALDKFGYTPEEFEKGLSLCRWLFLSSASLPWKI